MAKFTAAEWKKIRAKLNADPQRYGLPTRVYGSVVLASANVRKLGAVAKRDADTWRFFADVFRHFDLLAVQEVLDEMGGLRHLKRLMGVDFGMIVSDTTGAFPNSFRLTTVQLKMNASRSDNPPSSGNAPVVSDTTMLKSSPISCLRWRTPSISSSTSWMAKRSK